MICTRWYNTVVLLFILITQKFNGHINLVYGTKVEWTPSQNQQQQASSGKETAATAPRSQKYWDEHGIERPDYAKTDAELARDRQEKGGNGGSKAHSLWVLLVFGTLCFIGYQWSQKGSSFFTTGKGHRLNEGGSVNILRRNDVPSLEEARKARLARFETENQMASQATDAEKED